MNPNPNNKEDQPTPVAEEPTTAFARRTSDLSSLYSCSETVSKPGRMTVKEYFDELHKMVDEYYDSIQS